MGDANETILVTGGSGNLGGLVVDRLREAGRSVRVASRRGSGPRGDVEYVGADLETGQGVADALAGIATVVHCAGGQSGDGHKAETLVAAAKPAGVSHVVYISVVGAERIPVKSSTDRRMFGYFEQKRAAEVVIENSGIPWTTLRATQFHDLVLTTVKFLTRLPVVPMPRAMRVQPVEVSEVADRLTQLALGEPAGLVPDLAGPKAFYARDLVRDYLRRTGKHRPIMPVHIPGAAAKVVVAEGGLVPQSQDAMHGSGTWEQFLSAQGI